MNRDELSHVLSRTLVNVAREYNAQKEDLIIVLMTMICQQFRDTPEARECIVKGIEEIFRQVHDRTPPEEQIRKYSLEKQKIDN